LIILSSVTDKLVDFQTHGAYPKAHMDVNLSSDDDIITASKPDTPTGQKGSAGDDTGDDGVTLAEPITLGPISSVMPEQSKPSITNQVPAIVHSSRKCARKCTPPVTKRSNPIASADHMMSQVELPPYREPCSPLDLVSIEIIFGHIFEAFQQISQVVVADATSADASRPMKKMCRLPIRKTLIPW
jgi:hypothetical protein